MEEHRQLTVDLKHLYVLDLKFDKKKKRSTLLRGSNLCVDWLGFSHVFYTKMELIKPFFTKPILVCHSGIQGTNPVKSN